MIVANNLKVPGAGFGVDGFHIPGEASGRHGSDVFGNLLIQNEGTLSGDAANKALGNQGGQSLIDRHAAYIVLLTELGFGHQLIARMKLPFLNLIDDILCDYKIPGCVFQ